MEEFFKIFCGILASFVYVLICTALSLSTPYLVCGILYGVFKKKLTETTNQDFIDSYTKTMERSEECLIYTTVTVGIIVVLSLICAIVRAACTSDSD